MRSGSLSVSTRRAFFVMVMVALLCGASGMRAQQAAAAAPAAQAAQDDPFKFSTENELILFQVKPEKTADFESAWGAIKDKLSKSDKADWKELGDSLKIYKVAAAAAAGNPVIYVFQLNPPSKTLSYDPGKILYAPGGLWPEAARKEADDLYNKIKDALAGLNFLPLSKVGG
jgi:hypothetical protein